MLKVAPVWISRSPPGSVELAEEGVVTLPPGIKVLPWKIKSLWFADRLKALVVAEYGTLALSEESKWPILVLVIGPVSSYLTMTLLV